MTILAHMQGKNIDHYSTGLCIKKFSVINMWICHAVKTSMWFCGGGAYVMYEQLSLNVCPQLCSSVKQKCRLQAALQCIKTCNTR